MPQVIAFIAGAAGVSATAAGAAATWATYTAFEAGAAFASTIVGGIVISGAEAIAFSELRKALSPNQNTNSAPVGVQGSSIVGEDKPISFILGKYATAGWAPCPDQTHGTSGETPNAYLTQVRTVSDVAGCSLSRVLINGTYYTLNADDGSGYGQPVSGVYNGLIWIKFYDGSQTTADAMLLSKYGSAAERPWTSGMIGTGTCYAIATCKIDHANLPSVPSIMYELNGIPLYDPRKDSTNGGTGTHRYGTPSTYEATENPMVMAYNVYRGIVVGADTWGAITTAAQLPTDEWFAAMNACDVTVTNGDSTTEAAYRAGYEVTVDMEPANVLDQLKITASAEFAEIGGVFKVRVGGPGLPAYFFTDDDVIITTQDDFAPFPGLDKTYNAVSATYPDPESAWQAKTAPLRTDATYQTADQDRQLTASLALNACPYPNQVQRLQLALLQDNRRFRVHNLTLPPDAAVLEPLDSVSWTSTINGYTSKVFEVTQVVDDVHSCLQVVAIRERDSGDYSWSSSYQLPTTAVASTVPIVPGSQALAGFTVAAAAVEDTGSTARLSAIDLSWTSPGTDDIKGIRVQIRRQADQVVVADMECDPALTEVVVSQGIVAGVTYECRAIVVPFSGRATSWTSWSAIVAPDVTNTPSDGTVTTAKIVNYSVTARAQTTADQLHTPAGYFASIVLHTIDLSTVGSNELIVAIQGTLKFTTDSVSGSPAVTISMRQLVTSGAQTAGSSVSFVTGDQEGDVATYPAFYLSTSEQDATIQKTEVFTSFATNSYASLELVYNFISDSNNGTNTHFEWVGTLSVIEVKR